MAQLSLRPSIMLTSSPLSLGGPLASNWKITPCRTSTEDSPNLKAIEGWGDSSQYCVSISSKLPGGCHQDAVVHCLGCHRRVAHGPAARLAASHTNAYVHLSIKCTAL